MSSSAPPSSPSHIWLQMTKIVTAMMPNSSTCLWPNPSRRTVNRIMILYGFWVRWFHVNVLLATTPKAAAQLNVALESLQDASRMPGRIAATKEWCSCLDPDQRYQSAGARNGFKVRGGAKLHELGNQKFCQRFIKSGNQTRATGFYDTRQLWGN